MTMAIPSTLSAQDAVVPQETAVPQQSTTPQPSATPQQSASTPVLPVQNAAPEVVEMETITVNGVSFNMVKVSGGIFTMGATEEQGTDAKAEESPAHEVIVSDYLIGETEVTQELWEAVMGGNPSHFVGPQRPVESIRYVDCSAFFFKLNYLTNRNFRLPTEAEWEYAARGGHKSQKTKYSGSNEFDEVAWYCNNSGNETHDVKTKAPNELGLYDMSGNVDEWCGGAWRQYGPDLHVDAKEEEDGSDKVRRGGGFLDFASHLRVSDRRVCPEKMYNYDIGLRLAE